MSDEFPCIRAERHHWKIKPMPDILAAIPLELTLTLPEYEQVQCGMIPQAMEDRWFMFAERDWLYVYMSATGDFVYSVRFAPASGETYCAVEAWVACEILEMQPKPEADAAFLLSLIYGQLLDNEELSVYWFDQSEALSS